MHRFCVFVVHLILLSSCSCELSVETRDKFINGFIDYLNNLPNQAFVFEEGTLLKADHVADNCYKIEANIKASDLHNVNSIKQLYCITTLLDLGEIGISVPRNEFQCSVTPGDVTATADAVTEGSTTEAVVERRPVQLDNEIQSGNAITSGEQFIAIPRDHPAPCIGCSTKIDPRADGVNDLAGLCVRHIDRHEPNVKHTLVAVLDVERQVQVVNGVRYILTMTVDFKNCTETETENCNFEKDCKVTVLEKPWVKLPDGSKYRAILANNCTQQWLFGDNGEVLQENNDNNKENNEINVNPFNDNDPVDKVNDTPNQPTPDYDKIANTGSVDDILKVVHNTDLQAKPIMEKELTNEQMRNLQEQIIPLDKFKQYSHDIYEVHHDIPKESVKDEKNESIDNVETEKHVSDTAVPIGQSAEKEQVEANPIPDDKKKAIDELMNLFNFPIIDSNIEKTIKKRYVRDLKDEERKKRSLVGGNSDADPKDPKYQTLAEESLKKYLESSGNNNPHKVVEVTKVTKQVVSGLLTHIYFKVSPVDKAQEGAFDCHSKIWEQSWLNKKDITVNCEENKNKSRKKRQIPGGVSEVDPKDPKYQTLAEESLKKYLESSGNNNPHKVLEVTKVTNQVVSGLLTHVYFKVSPIDAAQGDAFDCHSKIWEQSWLNKKDITVNCEVNTNKSRKKRQIPGGDSEVDPKDPKYKTLAEESLNKYLESSGNNNPHKVLEVTKVTNQVVSGLLTHIYFKVSPIDAAQGDAFDCHSKIWEQSWLNKKDITVNCEENKNKSRKKRQIPGGVSEVDPKDPKYQTLAEESLEKYLESSGNNNPHKVLEVTKVTNQVVSGLLTHIYFKVSPIDAAQGDAFDCHSKIWEQVWLNKKEITVNCSLVDENKSRVKRQNLIGGPKEKNAKDPKYIKLAKESLARYLTTSGNDKSFKVIDVIRATVQIVAGTLTRIHFRVSSNEAIREGENDAFHCHAEIWERVWLNSKIITVKCNMDEMNKRKKRDVSSGISDNQSNYEYGTLAEEQEMRHMDGQPFFGGTISHFKVESAENAMGLAEESLKHIEAKYPHPRRQKVVRIFSLQKQAVAGLHYRLKLEIGNTDCMALSLRSDCKLVNDSGLNRFCRVNVWIRPGTDHPPTYRVACINQEESISQMYHHIQAQELFKDFISNYKPDYMTDDVEMSKRFDIFKANVRKIHDLNIYERGTGRYGVTRFTDLSGEEFRGRHLGLDVTLRDRNAVPLRRADIPSMELPDHFDWRDMGAVTEVKNQGSCGSCWAFSVTGNIEGQWKRRSGKLVSLSEQELVDCDTLDHGCNGGLPDNAYRAIEQLGGLELESDYPYDGEDEKCSFNKTLSRVQISGAVNISSNESDMAKWLVGNGPISIGINANAMQFYVGGVSHPWKMLCNPKKLDHGVLIVGYGAKDYPLFHKHLPYWIVKNSWGKSWGEQGYYRVYRGDGTCGVNMMASSAII